MAANAGETKVKLWEGICYPENMLDDWQEEIDVSELGKRRWCVYCSVG